MFGWRIQRRMPKDKQLRNPAMLMHCLIHFTQQHEQEFTDWLNGEGAVMPALEMEAVRDRISLLHEMIVEAMNEPRIRRARLTPVPGRADLLSELQAAIRAAEQYGDGPQQRRFRSVGGITEEDDRGRDTGMYL